MDIKSLKVFVTIVQKQSFSHAAEALFVTQPTISKLIRQLEDEIGVPLFHKGEAGRKGKHSSPIWESRFISMP